LFDALLKTQKQGGRGMLRTTIAVSVLALGLGALPASAQDNIQKLQQMQTTGTSLQFQMVEQSGPNADAIRKNLAGIKLPPGFKIDLYAVVPDARHMAVGPSTGMVFVGTRKTAVYAVTDRNKDRVADEVKPFAPSVNFVLPNGVCMSRGGRILLRRAGHRDRRGGRPRQADSAGRRVLQPHRPRLRHRAGQQALYHAGAAFQRAAAGKGGPL
jgi:hypothetical protein